ncbi:hypothetical protein EIN_384980 [Entamoeba invadens IP1]|uniref:PiggyBac transposable element-derived protein domain-containing protein n=1 Tax=Entamoeba invadens IP1 TaxID=370355 RepID=A0A0A1U7C8_ENTIV|nr:hypothetical protein EIN_384980 [Entamoeba invadens IP1]ELP90235.1 hypothetical protein EIN_384980 [Entamoeba invadens IP1]|eukprot:XP_004257006.1 hypothetical protein EIN_384980 [Entamoeba invadens IP1]
MWAKVFIKSKPGRYGIKFWICADYETGMTLNLQMYLVCVVVRRTIKALEWSGIWCYPCYAVVTSLLLCVTSFSVHYLASCGCQLLGTMRINRKELPDKAKTIKKRTPDTTIFFSKGKCKLISYFNEKKKLVLVLSTCH